MKIITYNVNGIRSAISKNWLGWLQATDADIICLQEIKANPEQVPETEILTQMGYHHFWYPAQKKGYSGTAIFCKQKPLHVEYGCGNECLDFEGRVIRVDFENLSVISAYFPSGTTGDVRQVFKYEFLDFMYDYIRELSWKYPNLIVAGDYNICHKSIDIHNPKANANSSGFLPEERAWMDKFTDNGFIDTFRHFNNEPHNYTWWSFRAGSRGKNLGWRIDYLMCTEVMKPMLKRSAILADACHSDHCPVMLEFNL